jgi:hypothetical protein
MFRQFSICFVTMSTAMLTLAGVSRADGYTTRIETRPVYGATTTMEHGVRVIRPLPPVRQVIINPNRTPLSLGFNETNVYEHSANYNDDYGRVRRNNVGAYGVDGPIYSYPAYGRFGRGHGRFGHHSPRHRGHGHAGPGHAGPQHGGAMAGPGR